MLHHHLPRVHRTVAGLGAGLVVASGIAMVASSTASAAPVSKTVLSHTIDFSETRATGHNDFVTGGVRVWTQGSTSTDKAAAYFDVDQPLSVAATTEPVMNWTKNAAQTTNSRPGNQLKVDFDGNGSIDATLVGEPVYADNSPLYGDVWWVPDSAANAQFVKDGAPSNAGGFGSQYNGTLDQWSEEFPNAQIIQGGWSLGSGVQGDGVISSMLIGETTYTFAQSPAATSKVLYRSDVDLSQSRARGTNEFLEAGGVRIATESNAASCSDLNPNTPAPDDTWCTNKAAGYFVSDVALADAGEPSLSYQSPTGTLPSVQLVTDFDGNGTADAILVGETVYGRDWWVPGSAAQFVKDGAPRTTGGSGSSWHGLLSEWRAAFPDARIQLAGWSLGSGAEGSGVISKITVGLNAYSFTGVNRAPKAGAVSAATKAGRSVTVTLPGTDADGDELTYTADRGTVVGNKLTFAAPAAVNGLALFEYEVTDGTDAATGYVAVRIDKAPTALGLSVAPQKLTVGKKATLKVTVSSTGALGGKVVFFDGAKRLGAADIKPNGTATFKTGKLTRGQHAFKAVYNGSRSTLATQRTVRKQVRRG